MSFTPSWRALASCDHPIGIIGQVGADLGSRERRGVSTEERTLDEAVHFGVVRHAPSWALRKDFDRKQRVITVGRAMRSRGATRISVVGYGYWGSKHVRVLSTLPGVEVTVVDNDATRVAEARRNFPAVRSGSSLAQVIDDVDGVIVATPPRKHAEIALQVLRSGKHTLVEKPLATSVPDARQLIDAATESGVQLMVGHTFEYNAAVWKLREVIRSGEIGRVLYIDTARLNLGLYQSDVNVIWDLAPHDLSIISFLMDETPASVSTWAHHNIGNLHADVAYLRLELEASETYAFVHVSWLDPQKVRRVTVVGDRKMAVYNDTLDDERIRIYDIGVDPSGSNDPTNAHAMPVTYRSGDIVSPHVAFREPLLVQDEHFVDCLRAGRRPNTPGESGLEIVRVLNASDLAQTSGRSMRIADLESSSAPGSGAGAQALVGSCGTAEVSS